MDLLKVKTKSILMSKTTAEGQEWSRSKCKQSCLVLIRLDTSFMYRISCSHLCFWAPEIFTNFGKVEEAHERQITAAVLLTWPPKVSHSQPLQITHQCHSTRRRRKNTKKENSLTPLTEDDVCPVVSPIRTHVFFLRVPSRRYSALPWVSDRVCGVLSGSCL